MQLFDHLFNFLDTVYTCDGHPDGLTDAENCHSISVLCITSRRKKCFYFSAMGVVRVPRPSVGALP